jgi:sec-independent protein translocase protein TatB
MFDIGWSEMAVIAVITLIVVGPKDLPNVLRTGARWMRQVRKLSREFQSGVDSLVREAELEDAKKIVASVKQGSIKRQVETAIDPTGEMSKSLDPKRMVREAEAGEKKPASAKPADAPAIDGAKKATGTSDTLEGGPVGPSPATPSTENKPAPEPAAATTPATDDASQKIGS